MSETDDDSQSPDRDNQDACRAPGLVPRPLISLGPGVQGLFLGKSGGWLGSASPPCWLLVPTQLSSDKRACRSMDNV